MGLEDDLDDLVRETDALCASRDWDGLVALRARCAAALERGHQHWPIISLVDYRLALRAPAELAAAQVHEDRGRFALGPLGEVAASTHTWAELEPFLPDGPYRAVVAHERALRGDDLRGVDLEPHVDVPLVLGAWEPTYAVATYHDDRVDAPRPPLPTALRTAAHIDLRANGARSGDDEALEAEHALRQVVQAWATTSDAVITSSTVHGDATDAIAALGVSAAAVVEADPADALAQLAWAGASGGAHGRRRGAAAGRTTAWWAVAALAGLAEDWPVSTHELGEAIAELQWFLWEPGDPDLGWRLHLAVHDAEHDLAWALSCVDAPAEGS